MSKKPTLLERAAARSDVGTAQRQELRREARRGRRRWQADLATWRLNHPEDSNQRRTMTQMPNAQGRPTTNPEQWSRALRQHCAAKYDTRGLRDDEGDASTTADERQRNLMRQLDDEVANKPSSDIHWTWQTTTRARASLNRQKSTGKG